MLLALHQEWFAVVRPWVDPDHAQKALLMGVPSGDVWAHLAVTTAVWLLLPALIGMRNLLRSEVK